MASRADTHDLDKLKRWQEDLAAAESDGPAVYAVFLVSERDTVAHETFRIFRNSFEERGASFAHLVIFGQHGVSETARRLRAELELPEDMLPALALFGGDAEDAEYITLDLVSLHRGSEAEPEPTAPYWTNAMFWSDVIMSSPSPGNPAMVTNVLAGSPAGQSGSAMLDLEEVLLWAEAKMDESIEAGGPPELNRVLTKRLSDICAAAVRALEEQSDG